MGDRIGCCQPKYRPKMHFALGRSIFLLFYVCFLSTCTEASQRNQSDWGRSPKITSDAKDAEHENVYAEIHLLAVNFDHVKFPLLLCTGLFLLAIAKLVYHHADYLSSVCPESCMLIVVGIVGSLIVHLCGATNHFVFEPRTFFLYLLPPIMLEAAFNLNDRAVWENLGTILLFAGLGTVLNTLIIAPILCVFNGAGMFGATAQFDLTQCFLFAALISAVDPVAVLAIFDEINVNASLYFIVFGESLLNDAVTVVLYRTMEVFVVLPDIPVTQMAKGCVAFFTVSFGGLAVGVTFGAVASFLTKHTHDEARVIEPLIVYSGAFFAYLLAECFEFSGIIAIICCGLVLSQYAFANISRKSHTVVICSSKLLSSTCDCVIFLFLGMEFTEFVSGVLSGEEHICSTFVTATLMLCLITRFFIVISLSFILNLFRVRKILKQEQFIMCYGGLRGAVCFSLVKLLDEDSVPEKQAMMSACLAVIFFTVFIQGITMKPIVKALRIQLKEEHDPSMNQCINTTLIDHVMAGVEEVIGHLGDYRFKELLTRIDNDYVRGVLLRPAIGRNFELQNLYAFIMMRQQKLQLAREMKGGMGETPDKKSTVIAPQKPNSAPRLTSVADSVFTATYTCDDHSGQRASNVCSPESNDARLAVDRLLSQPQENSESGVVGHRFPKQSAVGSEAITPRFQRQGSAWSKVAATVPNRGCRRKLGISDDKYDEDFESSRVLLDQSVRKQRLKKLKREEEPFDIEGKLEEMCRLALLETTQRRQSSLSTPAPPHRYRAPSMATDGKKSPVKFGQLQRSIPIDELDCASGGLLCHATEERNFFTPSETDGHVLSPSPQSPTPAEPATLIAKSDSSGSEVSPPLRNLDSPNLSRAALLSPLPPPKPANRSKHITT